jgi:hypothetical protein
VSDFVHFFSLAAPPPIQAAWSGSVIAVVSWVAMAFVGSPVAAPDSYEIRNLFDPAASYAGWNLPRAGHPAELGMADSMWSPIVTWS